MSSAALYGPIAQQALRAAHAGDDAEVDLGLTESRGVGGEDDIAHHGELASAAEGVSRDGGDHRRAHRREARPLAEVIVHRHLEARLVGHLLDVGAGGERLLRPGQHDGADALVGVEAGGGVDDLAHHRRVERVERLGTVEGDPADAAARVGTDGLVVDHAVLLGSSDGARTLSMMPEKSRPAPPPSTNSR